VIHSVNCCENENVRISSKRNSKNIYFKSQKMGEQVKDIEIECPFDHNSIATSLIWAVDEIGAR